MIKSRFREERFTVCEFIDRNGETASIKDATIIMCASESGFTMPFTKTELGGSVKIGDTFIQRTVILPDAKKS